MTPAVGYTEKKDSGIEWVGEIPAHWNIFPAGGVFSEVKEKNVDNEYNNPFSFRYGEIVDKRVVGEIDENMEETLSAYRVVSPNTIMLNGLNLNYDFVSQRVAIVKRKGIITSAYLAIQPDEKLIYPPFALYLLKAYDFRQVFHGIGSGIRKTLKYSDFKNIKIIAPEMKAQKTIAAYLDTQCARIDEIIAEAKASIEDYKQWKASIIYEAVTKGLDPDAEMKDSGIEWIGEIPKGWKLNRLKYMFAIKKDIIGEIGHTVLAITQQGIKPKNMSDKGQFALDYSKYQIVNPGDFAMNHMDLLTGWVDISQFSGVTSPDYRVFYSLKDEIGTDYYKHLFQTCYRCRVFYGLGQGVSGLGRWRLPAEMFLNFVLPVPPLNEQKEIATFLGKECSQIDALTAEKQALITDLEAYKKSLIYEVVTGKRKVC